MSNCRDCGGRLLGTDRGRCGNCERATETPQERAAYLLRDKGNLTAPEPPKGNLTVTSQPEEGNLTRTVVPDDKGERETKQQRWKRKNAEAKRTMHRDGQRRRRAE